MKNIFHGVMLNDTTFIIYFERVKYIVAKAREGEERDDKKVILTTIITPVD